MAFKQAEELRTEYDAKLTALKSATAGKATALADAASGKVAEDRVREPTLYDCHCQPAKNKCQQEQLRRHGAEHA